MRHTPIKKRSQLAYNNKVNKITDWYNHLIDERKQEIINPNTKQETKRKPLKELNWYLEKIKKPTN